MKQKKRQSLGWSFRHAFDGLFKTIKEERNIKIHLFIACLVVLSGIIFRISRMEWIICIVLFGQVLSLELVNTALESVVDLVTDEWKPLAKTAKDAAAGAVLIAAIMAAIAGLLIFIPQLIDLLRTIS
ncbi:MAG: diacylglycerol kinase family protein [Eubacterium sp.]|nr:diacylglycerol kinase family protein [Eubacterium sp.]